MRFEKNGRRSCGPNSRHIDIRYFWIKDRLSLENFEVKYCPTEEMLADFFTKPLQGNLFRRLRAVVMGHKHVDSLLMDKLPATQERVGDSEEKGNCESRGIGVSAPNVSNPKRDVTLTRTDVGPQQPFTLVGKKGKAVAPSYANIVKGVKTSSIKSERNQVVGPLTLNE
jgi:hypothetical protein